MTIATRYNVDTAMPNREQTQDLLAGAIGDKYEVLEWIGGGGMADVYLARHRLTLGFCAVKVLSDYLAHDEAVVERFLQEARTAANLEGNPNIVRIHDIGENRGLYYLIMQFVEGEDLATFLDREGPLTPDEVIYVLSEVAKALGWAHQHGVVHRDMKPANVRMDRNGRLIVLDFGIAKATTVPSALTSMGEKLGTPYYMAPEQIRGETITFSTDLYALGVMGFELLTQRKPFDGESYQAIEQGHLNNEAPDPHEIDDRIPTDLADVILRLLEKDPANRYQSAGELVDDPKRIGTAERPPEFVPEIGLDLEHWRQKEPESPTSFGQSQVDPEDNLSRGATVVEPARSAPSGPSIPAAPPMPSPDRGSGGSKAWPIFIGGGALIIAALVAAFMFTGGETDGDPGEAPVVNGGTLQTLDEVIQTPTGNMLLVSSGSFTYGDNSPESPNPLARLDLPNFYIDETEVSNAQYKQFCDATGHAAPPNPPFDSSYFLGKPNHPVLNVTLDDARAYAVWAGKRIPSEHQWEKAARGPDGYIYPWGIATPSGQANVSGTQDGFRETAPVNAFPAGASPYGALNMSGNVYEWTDAPYQAAPQEMSDRAEYCPGSATGPWSVVKGGAAAIPADDLDLRSYFRTPMPGGCRIPYVGFRCVKNVETTAN